MMQYEKGERINLLRALEAASNAFHETLRERGYSVSYGASDCYQTGSIRKIDVPPYDSTHIGELTIVWRINNDLK